MILVFILFTYYFFLLNIAWNAIGRYIAEFRFDQCIHVYIYTHVFKYAWSQALIKLTSSITKCMCVFVDFMNIVRRIPMNSKNVIQTKKKTKPKTKRQQKYQKKKQQKQKQKPEKNKMFVWFVIKPKNTQKVIPNSLQLSLDSLKLIHRLLKNAHGRVTIEHIIAHRANFTDWLTNRNSSVPIPVNIASQFVSSQQLVSQVKLSKAKPASQPTRRTIHTIAVGHASSSPPRLSTHIHWQSNNNNNHTTTHTDTDT